METVPTAGHKENEMWQPGKWRDFLSDPPYFEISDDEIIALHRLVHAPWQNPIVRRLGDLPPEMNVVGLSWRRL